MEAQQDLREEADASEELGGLGCSGTWLDKNSARLGWTEILRDQPDEAQRDLAADRNSAGEAGRQDRPEQDVPDRTVRQPKRRKLWPPLPEGVTLGCSKCRKRHMVVAIAERPTASD